jgi:hypothetical protein
LSTITGMLSHTHCELAAAQRGVAPAADGEKLRARSCNKPAVRPSLKPWSAANDNLIDRTIALWKSRLQRDLSREDARQIAENVTGFFNVLAEWSRAELPVPANDNAAQVKVLLAEEEKDSEAIVEQGEQGRS